LEQKMKRLSFIVLCAALTAFAGPFDIDGFDATDVGSPDQYITAEFGGQLKKAPASEVGSLQSGRLVVRQKFEDPFGESETTYQLYQGRAGDLSSLVPLTAEGADYSDIVKAKIYQRKGMDAEEDAEKVYFDGKFIYVPGMSSAIAYVNNAPVELKGAEDDEPVAAAPAPAVDDDEEEEDEAPVAAKKPRVEEDEEECDEYDPDCEDEEEYDVKGNLDRSNREADARDYAASDASENATDRFGIADEVRFWSAVALSAVAVGSAVMGVYQHMKANEARDAYDSLGTLNDKIINGCDGNKNCEEAVSKYGATADGWTVAWLQERMDINKKTQDSYATARNIWFGVTAVSLTAAIVLFVW
jgi:hypothetical protein